MAHNPTSRESAEKEHQRIMRDLRQQGQAALTWGLPNPTTEAGILGMGLVIQDRLNERGRSDRAASAAALAAEMLDRTLSRMPQASSVQCVKGCSFCCQGAVAVTAPELFRIARLIGGEAGPDRSGVLDRAKRRSSATVEGALMLRAPCPLLIEDACSVYLERPLGCRQFISTDREGCRTAYARGTDLPFVPAAANAGLIMRSLLLGAVGSIKLKPELVDLSSGLEVVLAMPDAEARWLAGDDVLAGALKLPLPPNMQTSTRRWAEMLAGLHV